MTVPLGLPSRLPPDSLGRPLRDLRISVTDRCNFRCVYCMPKEVFGRDYAFLPKNEILTFEEIARVARVAVAHGVEKIRLTGGEPLLRRGIEELVAALAELRTSEGRPVDVALTTNGSALAVKARALKDAGLSRVSVSLDSLDPERFAAMNDVDFPVAKVLRGIDTAREAGLDPVKVNMVVKRGTNDADVLPMARHFKGTGVIVRFIEFMDVGSTNGWRMDEVLPSAEVVARIDAELPLEPAAPSYRGETAARWRYRDGGGEIGVISSVTAAFCRTCTRARLSTDGKLFTCLFAERGQDLRAVLRDPSRTDADLAATLGGIWAAREDRYSELRATLKDRRAGRIEMSYIGG
ncbi:GTP 3',8-cyclase MoaA [Georgenia thermotolerans]|uniref:GTP 3',8-cyclase n=1 Tax=Georgenia thermotolerans TaxID=527326 RepID=A0A7J5UUZ0_9MICO|nr:GTP 3',8-cyclase MoaA [Georgenia thermotolerans]KAE8766083.1 GTP 3',8-cyclase MoaA [Georgenia thermotolerans]